MNITLWGVRGSIPTTRPDTKEYGGNTSCVEVEADGRLLILDAGSGIQGLNFSRNLDNSRIDILLTHLHIDHIQGLGFFNPLFNSSKEVHIWGPVSKAASLRSRLGRYFSPPLFPVYFSNLTCRLFFHEIENSSFTIVGIAIMAAQPANFFDTSFWEIEIREKFASNAVFNSSRVLSTTSFILMA